MRFGEKLLNSAERKFGGLAFPGILRWIAGFQLLGYMLALISPGYMEMIIFSPGDILSGEVWRLVTWLFVPRASNPLFILIVLMFTFFISDILENAMGVFRTTAYVVCSAVCLTLVGMIPILGLIVVMIMPFAFFSAMVMAAAIFAPDLIIRLFFVIPIKLKWVGVMDALVLVGLAFAFGGVITLALVLLGLLPFMIGVFPILAQEYKNNAKASVRRAKFQRDTAFNEDGAFHSCKECGITDVKDSTMEFRVSSDDGEEYCVPCREKQITD